MSINPISPLSFNPTFLRRVWQISWPTVVYALLDTVVGMVDLLLAGYIGPEAVAGIGFSNQIYYVLMIGTISITTGTLTLVAQYFGAKRYDLASSVAIHSLWISIASGIVIGVVGMLSARACIDLLGASPEVVDLGSQYLRIIMAGVVFMMINYSTNATYRALGDTKTPLKISLFINLLNVAFSYILMFGLGPFPHLGIQGIALGTVIARALGGLMAIVNLAQHRREIRLHWGGGYRKDILLGILRIGVPSGFSGFFRNGARILFFAIIAATSAGTQAVAAATIGFQIRMISIMPSLAFQVATSALVGQSLGARRVQEAEEYGWTAIKLCSYIMAVTSLIVFFFPETLMSLFTDETAVLALSSITLRSIAVEQFCNCVAIVVSGALAGAGDTRPFMRYTILAQWVLMLPLAYGLSRTHFDIAGAWWVWGLAPALQMALTLARYTGGHWKTLKIASLE